MGGLLEHVHQAVGHGVDVLGLEHVHQYHVHWDLGEDQVVGYMVTVLELVHQCNIHSEVLR